MLSANVSVRLGVLDLDVSLEASAAEVVAVLGPNGAGKTTLLRAIAGLIPIDAGRIELDGAVLDDVFSGLKKTVFRVLDGDQPPREKILAYVGAYFDFIASNRLYPRLMQREMMRAREGQSPHIDKVIKNYIQPIFMRVAELIKKGTTDGEFRPVNPAHFVPSIVAMIVFYFSSAPMMQKIVGFNPLTPERIAERRASVLDFVSAALFRPERNAGQGARL